jgi:hypothetical protein
VGSSNTGASVGYIQEQITGIYGEVNGNTSSSPCHSSTTPACAT